jgi:hypothetical protein
MYTAGRGAVYPDLSQPLDRKENGTRTEVALSLSRYTEEVRTRLVDTIVNLKDFKIEQLSR